ncbi:tetraspanin Tsp3, partial [Metarhizium majus ARSEF 297]
MFNPGIAYMLVCVVLFAIAVVIHYHTIHLSLPISSAITILSTILPITAFLNAYVYPNLLRSSHTFTSGDIFTRLAPIVLQGFQAIITAILATLLLEGVVPSPALEFLIDYEWDKLYQAKNADYIEYIQDTYSCCGLNSVDDRAYPFSNVPGGTCAEIHGRTRACRGPWTLALQAASGVDFGVVVIVGLMQIIGLLIMRERTAWWTALRTEDWKPFSETDDESSRRLATVAEESEESSEQGEAAQRGGYGAIETPATGPSASHEEAQRPNNG